jgi:hypothetical protein
MMSGKKILMGMALLLALTILAAQSFSQDEPAQPGRGRRGVGGQPGGPPGGPQMTAPPNRPGQMPQRDPEQMREMMRERQIQRIKQALKAADEQWAKIENPLGKVLDLSQQTGGMGFGGRMMPARGMRQGPEGIGATPPAEPATKLEKARMELRTALDGNDQKEITARLAAFRSVRDQAKKELEAAQKDLKKELTAPQEAELVLMGYLD